MLYMCFVTTQSTLRCRFVWKIGNDIDVVVSWSHYELLHNYWWHMVDKSCCLEYLIRLGACTLQPQIADKTLVYVYVRSNLHLFFSRIRSFNFHLLYLYNYHYQVCMMVTYWQAIAGVWEHACQPCVCACCL